MKIAVEQVSKYHPDKYADAIGNKIVRHIIKRDPDAHCGVEVLVKDTTVVVSGEIKTKINNKLLKSIIDASVKDVAHDLDYEVTKIINLIGKQSPQIDKAVMSDDNFGAGDQGVVTGYANILDISSPSVKGNMNKYIAKKVADEIIERVEDFALWGKHGVLKGDAKTLVIYDLEKDKISKIVLSLCHSENISLDTVKAVGSRIIIDALDIMMDDNKPLTNIVSNDFEIVVNPAGLWTIGGPIADAGVTGRKLVCDAYGPQIPIGGGNTNGKDGTKIDNSGALALRILSEKLLLAEEGAIKELFIELGYVIGQPGPCSINVITGSKAYDKKIYDILVNEFDLTPRGLMAIVERGQNDL